MLQDVDFSTGYAVLIKWAGNLFNNEVHVDPVELLRLDERNFAVALSALHIRRYGLRVQECRYLAAHPSAQSSRSER